MTRARDLSRRKLLTTGAAVSTTAALGLSGSVAEAAPAQVPRRILGKTKQSIPILLVGGGMGFTGGYDPRIRLALKHGANYIDTARGYAHGASEKNAGSTLHNLKAREKTWVTSKSSQWSAAGFEQDVALSLENLQTTWIDLYFLHGLDDPSPLDDTKLVDTVRRLKDQKKIRFFGFSCHDGNVPELLHLAAKRSFVDAVMFKYSFRDYGNEKLSRAMDAAHAAGVGLIAMKTQGSEAGFRDAWKKFEQKGRWTKHQAVLKAVWADERISAAVSHMTTEQQMRENIAAAVDRQSLGSLERKALERYAERTREHSCAGCDHICGAKVNAPVRIGTTMRCLMYHDAYGDAAEARRVFSQLPEAARRLDGVDFSGASRVCPNGVDVAMKMRRAAKVLV